MIRHLRLDYRRELTALAIYCVILALNAAFLAISILGGFGQEAREVSSFALGLVAACALASSLAFLITLRHRLLLIVAGSGLAATGAMMLGLTPAESLAKIICAAAAGLWISLMLTSIGQVLLIAVLIIAVDFYSVFFGPTKRMVESGGPWLEYLTISLPAFTVDATSRLGISDIIFFAIFTGCALTFRLRRKLTALAMTMSFVLTMIIGVTLDIGVPALPLLSVFFLLANADLLYRRFLQEPDSVGRLS